jgi:hypothetical protein
MPIGRHPPQPSLFDVPAVNAARDQGMTTVAEHAERVRPSFTEDALKFVVEYLRAHEPTSGEVLTLKCKLAGIVPHDDRAFGPIAAPICFDSEVTAKMVDAHRRKTKQ